LFFDFIDLAKKLQPKVVIAENVKGLLLGNAKSYVIEIYRQFDLAGYYVQHFLLDASKMGVPQRRERVFFIAMRKDLATPFLAQKDMFTIVPKLDMVFEERVIVFGEIADYCGPEMTDHKKRLWDNRILGDEDLSDCRVRIGEKELNFGIKFVYNDKVLKTLTSKGFDEKVLFDKPIHISNTEVIKAGTFPSDYNFCRSKEDFLIGMSVPPVMTANIATEVYNQWLKYI
jgi:DNA (cytosine-5)-methyltransferase 1